MTKQNNTGGGIGLGGLVWVVLIILKALGVIGMSWFWVLTSVIWVSVAIVLVFVIIAGLIAIITNIFL